MSDLIFSIITVCLNAGTKLSDTVQTVLSQTCVDYELIIKDGLSSDGSIELLSKDEHIKVVRCKDAGIFDAMNQAIAIAKGNYILFLNAGDLLYTPNVLERLLPLCRVEQAPDLIYTDFARGQFALVRNPARLTRFFLYRTMLCHQACFVRRKCFEILGGFDCDLVLGADFDFLLRLMLRSKATSIYFPMVSTSYLGGGYSTKPEIIKVGAKEVAALRKKYFPPLERFIYSLMYACTLPRVRIRILQSNRFSFLRTPYRHLVNIFYFICNKMRVIKKSKIK